ncbi:CRISPR-associated RAMP protein, Csm5 family [Methanotorris igneus Kol 5]|uniref:CRISPR system Cms protein Csm5 n=1 Tax=Methanotorris igneus (strain DSM 5666 / JCM 11834 / Kol 5) TaxID=880724 RepID=F6BET2_METIK|nr:type III-A CRISPR-associated RAMP protein Csm5 [Methanotorris igneus]AEF96879.1 CRISPR-associated RAMP protein, Csm5 family [Methanotorris igneus Kol 5]
MKLEMLSPLHIGSGETLTPADFIANESEIIVLDLNKLFNMLISIGANIDEITEILETESYPWKKILKKYNLNPKEFERYSLKLIGNKGKYSMQVRAFIKSGGYPYIPGSSIKGAIRTAIMYKIVKNNPELLNQAVRKLYNEVKDLNSRGIGRVIKTADNWLEARIFGCNNRGYYEPKKDTLKGLIIRDSERISPRKLKVYGVWTIGERGTIPQYVEGLENVKIDFEFTIDENLLKLNYGEFNGTLKDINWEFIENALREFYEEVIKVELREIHKYGRYRDEVLEFYQDMQMKLESGEIPIRIGWGSGWYSTTLGVLLKTHPNFENLRRKLGLGRNPKTKKIVNDFPKTRRVANKKPLGWCFLKC